MGLCVPSNDNRAVNIEVANDATGGDSLSDAAYQRIDLCVDICQRNGIRPITTPGMQTAI